jgi:RNA polymerase sigma-70 factor (ECF subfamily)
LGQLTSPSQAAMRQERARQLEESLASMDPIDQEVLALRHFEELSNSEVAEVLGIQQKAASIRYVRAIKRLKAIMESLPDYAADSGSEAPS